MKTLSKLRTKGLRFLSCLLLLSTVIALIGCGGGGGGERQPSRGKLKFSVIWPTLTPRVIPANAQSLLVEIKQGATTYTSAIIARPASSETFTELPVGAMSVVVTAFASTDATGTPLAGATVAANIVSDTTSTIDVSLVSAIDHLDVSPSPLTLGASLSGTITVTARDASNNVVLVDPTAMGFSSSNTGVVTVTSGGVATAGGSVGSATITITEADSGKTVSLSVAVVPSVTLSLSTATTTVRGSQLFVATVVGPANTSVTWSIQEGASGGTVTSGGLYVAPVSKGTYHVVATSVADTSRKATATVTVTSGGANVVVH